MSRFRYHILPRILFTFSVLLLLAGLSTLWLATDRPLPFSLAIQQTKTAYFLPKARLLATGPIHYDQTPGEADAWALSATGDQYLLMSFRRTAGVLWNSNRASQFQWSEEDGELFISTPDFGTHVSSAPSGGGARTVLTSEVTPVAYCTAPDVVSMETDIVWLSAEEREDPQLLEQALEERGVTVPLSPVGNGVWAGETVVTPEARGMLCFFCQGYDAAGELIAEYSPTAD